MAQRIADDFTRQMLALINVHLPDYGLRISGLVPLDKRLDFVEHFIPGLEERAAALYHGTISQAAVSEWIDTHLASYGKDARGLVREAMTAYVSTEREQAERRGGTDALQRLQHLKAMESAFFTPATGVICSLPPGEGRICHTLPNNCARIAGTSLPLE